MARKPVLLHISVENPIGAFHNAGVEKGVVTSKKNTTIVAITTFYQYNLCSFLESIATCQAAKKESNKGHDLALMRIHFSLLYGSGR